MGRVTLFISILTVASLLGCVDNEQSFYIEHAKMLPDPPDCTVSSGDAEASTYGMNLFLLDTPVTHFSVSNAIMSQEDYGRLRTESNGILVDGYEVYTLIPGEGAFGGTEYITYNSFMEAESAGLLAAQIMSSTTITQLRARFGCTPFSPKAVGDAIFSENDAILNQLRAMDTGQPGGEPIPQFMYAVVRFLGHTQGGKEVETQEFSIALNMWCGISGGWQNCIDDVCTAFCSSDATPMNECSDGMYSGGAIQPTCSDFLEGLSYTEMVERETGEVDTDGHPVTELVEQNICDTRCGN